MADVVAGHSGGVVGPYEALSLIQDQVDHDEAQGRQNSFRVRRQAKSGKKKTRYKARLVAQGLNIVPGLDLKETWAPVLNVAKSRALFAVSAANGLEAHHVDIKTSFPYAKMDKEIFITLHDGVETGETA